MSQGFIFTPGVWLGEGKILLSTSPENLKFYTKWTITQIDANSFKANQIVEIEGVKERMLNTFTFYDILNDTFKVILENEFVTLIEGQGSRGENFFKWQFNHELQTGFESYSLSDSETFILHAEYGLEEDYRTFIDGIVWRRSF